MKTDKEMILNPDNWPRWPVLTMKRYNPKMRSPDPGLLFADKDLKAGHPVIYILNIWDFDELITIGDMKAKAKAKFSYASIDAMIADGWKVD